MLAYRERDTGAVTIEQKPAKQVLQAKPVANKPTREVRLEGIVSRFSKTIDHLAK